ncbi:MAG: saccharopine dehydrogenase NADP-binding domain-containing protein [Spirochaetales bacterium]|nr:saccharopine dehydrogenase NADP-binding domain-containing protein [Spirochaetales bacterium]
MKIVLVGAGAVGEAIAVLARRSDPNGEWLERMAVCDYNLERAKEVAARAGDARFVPERVDAGSQGEIEEMCRKHEADFLMNACAPNFNMPIFHAAFQTGSTYMDMAMSLSVRHPDEPYARTHVKLGDEQFAEADRWRKAGLLAVLGSGVEPGMVNVFARYAKDHLFDEIHELNVRDGDNLTVEGMDVAFGFSIWTTIEECLNPPVVWERDRGWFTTASFSEAEVFVFPQPVGPTEVVNVEHEEVLMFPRYFADAGLKRCTFKYGLNRDFRSVLKTLEALGLDRTEKIRVGDVSVAPRDVVAAAAPDPARIGHLMKGSVCAGLWAKGMKEGMERSVYLYNLADNRFCMDTVGSQAVVAQTAFNPVIMMELLARGIWKGTGVLTPEFFPAEPFLRRMESTGFPPAMMEMESEYKRAKDRENLSAGMS